MYSKPMWPGDRARGEAARPANDSPEALAVGYCLSKQLQSLYALQSDYGEFPLDDELRAAVVATLKPLLEARLDRARAAAGRRRAGLAAPFGPGVRHA